MRSGRGFRMILHGKERKVPVTESLVGSVVQIDVCDLDLRFVQRFGIDGKSVVLRGDLDFACQQIFDRMVSPTMAKFQLEGLSAERQRDELMTQADTEDGFLADEPPDILDRNLDGGRVS